jgi:hypothetical protein
VKWTSRSLNERVAFQGQRVVVEEAQP